MGTRSTPKGPRRYKVLIYFFAMILAVLQIWLLAFILSDIEDVPGPNRHEINKRFVDASLSKKVDQLTNEMERVRSEIAALEETQELLSKDISVSKSTMDQMMEANRLNLERGTPPTAEQQEALLSSQEVYLAKQNEYQDANAEITVLKTQLRQKQTEVRRLNEQISQQMEPAQKEYSRLYQAHQWRLASFKLAFLIPLLLLTTWGSLKLRGNPYAPAANSSLSATFIMTSVVIHEYFPSDYFKYIALAVAIAVTMALIVYLIRMLTRPSTDWILRQNRESYQRHLCPVCSYPIQRGSFKQALWSKHGPVTATMRSSTTSENSSEKTETPYNCPSCGSNLFEQCGECGEVRPALLPYCQACGAYKEDWTPSSPTKVVAA